MSCGQYTDRTCVDNINILLGGRVVVVCACCVTHASVLCCAYLPLLAVKAKHLEHIFVIGG